IEHRVARAQAKIVDRTGILKSEALAIEQPRLGIEAIDVEPWLCHRKGDTEIKHLPSRGIKFGVRGEGTDLVQPPPEGAEGTCLERHRIELPWQALFAKGKERPMIRIDADIPRGLEGHAAFHLISGKGSAKRSKDGMTGLCFGDELARSYEAIGEV